MSSVAPLPSRISLVHFSPVPASSRSCPPLQTSGDRGNRVCRWRLCLLRFQHRCNTSCCRRPLSHRRRHHRIAPHKRSCLAIQEPAHSTQFAVNPESPEADSTSAMLRRFSYAALTVSWLETPADESTPADPVSFFPLHPANKPAHSSNPSPTAIALCFIMPMVITG